MKRKLFRLMAKLDPVKLNSTGKLDAAVAALIILDQTTDHRYVVKFLSKGFAEDWARLMVTQQVAQVNPYTFHFHAQLGWIVWASVLKNCNSLEGVLKVPCEISHCDSDDLHAELGWRGEDCQRPQVRAFVAVGDQLHLRSSPRDWWTVHEFRPRLNSVLLVARDQKRGGRKVHYREVHTLALMGCTVRRSLCVPCFRQSLCACECGEARRHSCVFQFPSPDSSAAVALIESASEGGRDGCSAALGLLHGDDEAFCSAEDQVRRMQREAGVRCWLKHKRGVAQAKAAMQALPPACSLNRCGGISLEMLIALSAHRQCLSGCVSGLCGSRQHEPCAHSPLATTPNSSHSGVSGRCCPQQRTSVPPCGIPCALLPTATSRPWCALATSCSRASRSARGEGRATPAETS